LTVIRSRRCQRWAKRSQRSTAVAGAARSILFTHPAVADLGVPSVTATARDGEATWGSREPGAFPNDSAGLLERWLTATVAR
jgi:hypothetical protein